MIAAHELSIEEIKARLDIPTVWRLLALSGEPGKSVPSPLREDRKPSFSVFDGGRRFRDHSTGDAGTVVDFVALALNLPLGEAVRWARERCGGAALPVSMAAPMFRARSNGAREKGRPMPRLRLARAGELETLAALRTPRAHEAFV